MKSIDEKIKGLESKIEKLKAEREALLTDVPTSIGGRIRKTAFQQGFSILEMAEYLGITPQTMSRYVNDERKISAQALGALALFLGTSCDYLIFGQEGLK